MWNQKLELKLELLFLTDEIVKDVGGDSNDDNPSAERGGMRPQLLQRCSFIRLTHEHSWKHGFSDASRTVSHKMLKP